MYTKLGIIGRFKPLHLGASALLETLCSQSEQVIIGIGSSNKYNLRNPFTAKESTQMINKVLAPNYSNYNVIHVPDFAHDPRYCDGQMWRSYVNQHFTDLDGFITGNPYVEKLLRDDYSMLDSFSFINNSTVNFPENLKNIRSTLVRLKIATNDDWESLVRGEVADYLKGNNLISRFKKEFGLETINRYVVSSSSSIESLDEELDHTFED
jgi:nicotinamide-nucleotide adenylyltransferase